MSPERDLQKLQDPVLRLRAANQVVVENPIGVLHLWFREHFSERTRGMASGFLLTRPRKTWALTVADPNAKCCGCLTNLWLVRWHKMVS